MSGTARSGGDRVANGQDTFPRDGLPSRPEGMSKEENKFWTLLLNQIPNELLRRIDAHQLQSLCECMALRAVYIKQLRADPLDRNLLNAYLKAVTFIKQLSPVFGLGPIDRRRMKLDQQPQGDDADEWGNEE